MASARHRRRKTRRRWLILAWVVAALALPASAAAQIELRHVDASDFPTVRLAVVTTRPSSIAPTLEENGAPAAGLRAENLGRSKSVALLVDQSKSMRGKPFEDAVAAARVFVSRKPHADRIAVATFGAQALQLTGFSTATIDADSGLRTLGVDVRTGTALYDAIAVAARSLASEPLAGRVILVLTDGADFASVATIDEATRAAREAGAAVYAIGIEGEKFSRAPLEQLARETGGSYFPAASSTALKAVYASVAEELRRTWRVEYVTSARPGERVTLAAEVGGQGSGTSSFEVPAALGAPAPAGREPSRLLPRTVYSSGWGPWAFGGIVGLIVLVAVGIALIVPRSTWIRQRLAPHIGAARPRDERSRERKQTLALSALYAVTERAFGRRRSWGRLQRLLWRADVPLKTVEFVYLTAGCGLFLALVMAIAAVPPVFVPAGFAAGVLGPLWVVWLKARRRIRAFEHQLPDMLMTLAASLKAGHSFRQGKGCDYPREDEPAAARLSPSMSSGGHLRSPRGRVRGSRTPSGSRRPRRFGRTSAGARRR